MASSVLAADSLSKRFGAFAALAEATLAVPEGSVFALLGPNGAGKTTLMRCCLGLVRPTSGRALLFGQDAFGAPPGLRQDVAAILEGPGLVGGLSARQNLVRHGRLRGLARAEAARAAEAALAQAGLGRVAGTPARRLSRGERQRVALAAAFDGAPRLLVLDEPTEGLDPLAIAALRDTVAEAHARGATVVISSHLLSEVERSATHAAVLVAGRVRVCGALTDLAGPPRLRLVVAPAARAIEVLRAAGFDAIPEAGAEGRRRGGQADRRTAPEPERAGAAADAVLVGGAADSAAAVAACVRADVAVHEVQPLRAGLEEVYRRHAADGASAA